MRSVLLLAATFTLTSCVSPRIRGQLLPPEVSATVYPIEVYLGARLASPEMEQTGEVLWK